MSKNKMIIFNENEESFYQKAISLLNTTFDNKNLKSQEALEKLHFVFKELEKVDPKEAKNFLNELKKQDFIFNFDKILNYATYQQMQILFKELAKIENLSKKEISQIQPLYYFIIGTLIHTKKNNVEKITTNEFLNYLDLDFLIHIARVKPDLPKNLINYLNKYFKNLPLLDLTNTTQTEEVYHEHSLLVTKLKKLIFSPDLQELKNNSTIMGIINSIMNAKKDVDVTSIQQYVSEILFDGSADEQDLEKINLILNDFIKTPEYVSNNRIIYGILDSILNVDLESLIKYTDEYINIYLNQASHKKNKNLTIEDKIILFFSDYFEEFQKFTNFTYKKFINIFIDFYDKDLFFGFMEHYKIPFNLGVREEKVFTTKNNEQLVTQSYYSLIEIVVFSQNFLMAKDLLEVDNILEPINVRVIENKNVFEYKTNPFEDMFYIEEKHLMFLIEMGIINENFIFSSIDEEKEIEIFLDPFSYFLKNGYEQCFIKLYKLNKEQNPNFSLKKYLPDLGLLSYYFITLRENESNSVNAEILNIFKEEGYFLYEENSEGYTPVDFLKDLNISLVVPIVAIMQDMFKKENPLINYQQSINDSNSNIILSHNSSELLPWFNRSELELHYKKLSKVKESDRQSSLEFIKTMLSNNNHLRKNLIIENEDFFDDLKAKFPNFKEVLDFYKGQFRLKKLTGKTRIQPVLLLGEAGVGKTYFAKEFAKLLNTGYTFIDMGSLTANWILSGNNGSWKNAKQGKILDSLMKSKTISPLILMDELDKARNGELDPTIVLYQLLEEINAKEFIDEYIDFPFDASNIIYIACANSIQTIPEPLLSRFKIFTIQKPENEQYDIIINNIYQEAIKNAKIFSAELEPSIIKKLKSFSLRSAKVAIDDAISSALLELSPEQIKQKIKYGDKIVLTVQHFKDPTKKISYGFNNK
jgi:hypothetical protein